MTGPTRLLLLCLVTSIGCAPARAENDPERFYPEKYLARFPPGALGRPFGESVVVQGKVIEGPFKLEDSSVEGRLLVQRINGLATQ